MANKTIADYTLAGTIDPVADLFLLEQASSTSYKSINRNIIMGVTGQPADISTAQTISNKSINNTNLITLLDTGFILQDNLDPTKQALFQLSGITTATTRSYTLPNASSTLVDLVTAQTLTNKTLTSPVITGGTISNSTITVDSIAGFTSASTSSIAGLSITSGIITTTGYATSTALQQNAVQGNQLATNAITLGYAQITTNFTTTSTTAVQVTGLTTTVTIPAGGRRVKITVFSYDSFATVSASMVVSIWDGTVGSGTQLSASSFTNGGTAAASVNRIVMAVVTPAAGSKTYNVGFATSAGTGSLEAAATFPAFILVECI